MIYLLFSLMLMAVTCFALFRVAEMSWRKTFWADIIGSSAVAIGGIWLALIYASQILDPKFVTVNEDLATSILYIGITLVMWTASCHRLGRRANDQIFMGIWRKEQHD